MELQAMNTNGTTTTNGRRDRVEAGLMAVVEAEEERDACQQAFDKLKVEHRGLQAEHDALRLAHARLQTEVEAYRTERDEAVEKRARADVLIEAVLTLLGKHRGQSLESELAEAKLA
jgi:hypothetical protein